MTTDFSTSRIVYGSTFTATCNSGHAFFRISDGNFTASTTKTAKCSYDGNTYWNYLDGTNALDDCLGNAFIVLSRVSSERNVSQKNAKILGRISQTFSRHFAQINEAKTKQNFAKIRNAKIS